MNLELLNPFSQAFPENHDSALEAIALCARFNPHGVFAGHYLAVGRLDGVVSVLDFETKGVVRWLEGHIKAVTVVCWSRNSRYLLTASRDWNVILWDLAASSAEQIQGARKYTIRFDAPVTSADLHPRNRSVTSTAKPSGRCGRGVNFAEAETFDSNIVVVTLHSQVEPVFVDSRKSCGGRWHLETLQDQDKANEEDPEQDEENDAKKQDVATVARFNPKGDLIYVGTSLGNIHVWDVQTKQHLWTEYTDVPSSIKHMVFNKEGDAIVLNSNDRCIRVFRLLDEPWDSSMKQDAGDGASPMDTSGTNGAASLPRPPRIPYFHLQHAFQDLVERTPWNGCRFSQSGDYIFGGAGHKGAHNIYIWDSDSGGLLKILEGPKDPLEDVDWHPFRPLIASVSTLGLIHLWTTGIVENWSAYAPGFEELDENREYEEKEDEFDIANETVVKRRKADQQDRPVDIFTSHRDQLSSAPVNLDDEYEAYVSIEPDGDADEGFYPPLQLLDEYQGEPPVESPSDTTALGMVAEVEETGTISEELGIVEPEPAAVVAVTTGKKRSKKR
ncbi:BQ5605_C016g08223 [Microbotryum silenes-dioicae]|uniref:BQ5605_C016g08223 protein n=1 Tax=Microbotryum silenes-dioicae TaxID=796604 RepID=A0A2X0LZK2_9BASI|nr:BQ5605_C016g08223 [Microbotryum silenes-dioicae]